MRMDIIVIHIPGNLRDMKYEYQSLSSYKYILFYSNSKVREINIKILKILKIYFYI